MSRTLNHIIACQKPDIDFITIPYRARAILARADSVQHGINIMWIIRYQPLDMLYNFSENVGQQNLV